MKVGKFEKYMSTLSACSAEGFDLQTKYHKISKNIGIKIKINAIIENQIPLL